MMEGLSRDFPMLVRTYGPWAVFAATFLEGELVLVTASILAAQGMLSAKGVWVGAFLGAWTGHLFWFVTGRVLGDRYLLKRFKRYAPQIAEINRMVLDRPKTVIFVLQYLYGMRVIGAMGLGAADLAFSRFALYEAVNCMIWALLVMSAGWFFGEAFLHVFRGWFRWVWLLGSLAVFLLFLHHLRSVMQGRMDGRGRRE